jgi:hypothetical protein
VADRLGIPRRAVAGFVGDGTLVRVDRATIIGRCLIERAATEPRFGHELLVRRLLRRYPECAASHESAAVLLGLPLLRLPPHPIGTRERGAWRGGGMRIRIAPLPPTHLTVVQGLSATGVPRTVADIARTLPFRDAVVVGDAALRRGVPRSVLAETIDECAGWADVGKARQAIGFLDGRSESALESVSRAIMHERDLPPPEIQITVEYSETIFYRLDFYWRAQRVIGEADGLSKYQTPDVLRAEKVRQEHLEQMDHNIVRWTFGEMVYQTDATIARIAAKVCR